MKPAGDARTKLIRTALGSIHRTSFENVGVAHITAKAGVPKNSFYHWVPSKEALGVEVIDSFTEAGPAAGHFQAHVDLGNWPRCT